MYSVIKAKTPRDRDLPDRYYLLSIYKSILDGTLYDCFRFPYQTEYSGSLALPEYVPEHDRAPCINSGLNLMRSHVEQVVGFVFGEDRFPDVVVEDELPINDYLAELIHATGLVRVMQDAVTKGSIGSTAIHVRVFDNEFDLKVYDTVFLTPTFDPQNPKRLIGITEKRKVRGSDLAQQGYAIAPADYGSMYWFEVHWDDQDETWFVPYKVGKDQDADFRKTEDKKRSAHHGFGFVPWIWIITGTMQDNAIDGQCLFEPGIEGCIQIDYMLSRADRALKYNSDPLIVLKIRNPNQMADFTKNSGNAMVIPESGDAKMLEIQGTAANAIIDTVKEIRDGVLHAMHGSRIDPNQLSQSNSSVAQRMLYLQTIQLATNLRVSYGDCGLIPLLKMMLQIATDLPIKINGKVKKPPKWSGKMITLKWNPFFPPTDFDKQQKALALQQAAQGITSLVTLGVISKETARQNLLDYLDFEDIDAEESLVEHDQEADADRQIALNDAMTPDQPANIGAKSDQNGK